MKLSVVIPAYNEAATLAEIVRRVQAVDGVEKEVIVVDDGSTDATGQVAESLPGVKVLHHERNRGKGTAVRSGIQAASGEIILIQDADLEYDPRDFPMLLAPIQEGRASVVYGSRFRGGPAKAMLFWHMVGNKFLTLLTNLLYDTTLTDMETGYKVFRADVLKPIGLRARGFEFEPEVTAKVMRRGHRIYEVPISYTGREYHEGKKITWKHGFGAIWALLWYRFFD